MTDPVDETARRQLDKITQFYVNRYGDRSNIPLNASARLRAEFFKRWVGTGRRLLEVGCGNGVLLACYCRDNDAVAMDVDKPALDGVRERLGVETVWGDFSTELPFPDESFDVVVAGETLEHMPYATIFLAEVRRVLRGGGMFVGSVPNAYRYKARLEVLWGRPIDLDPSHVQFFSLATLRAILAREFTAIEIVPIRGKWSHRWPSLFAHKLAWRCEKAAGRR